MLQHTGLIAAGSYGTINHATEGSMTTHSTKRGMGVRTTKEKKKVHTTQSTPT